MHTYCLSQSTEAFPVVFLDQLSPQTQSMGCHSQQSPVPAVYTNFTIILSVIITSVVNYGHHFHCNRYLSNKRGGWWRWALVSADGVAPSRMVGVSAFVNLPLHHKVQKFSSGTGSPGWSWKKGHKMAVAVVVETWLSLSPHGQCIINILKQCFMQRNAHSCHKTNWMNNIYIMLENMNRNYDNANKNKN